MRPEAIIRRCSQKIHVLLVATVLLTALGNVVGRTVGADSQTQESKQPASAEPVVIQCRVTGIQGPLVTVKTPDGYPAGPGGHALFVMAGPTFKVDVSHARILLPDGTQPDKLPLAVGDRLVMILVRPNPESPASSSPRSVNQTYTASIIERVVNSDKITTH